MVHIAPISPTESARLHLVAVTADGRRVYFSACDAPAYGAPAGAPPQRPTHLRAAIARQALPLPSAAGAPRSGSAQPSRFVPDYQSTLNILVGFIRWSIPDNTGPSCL